MRKGKTTEDRKHRQKSGYKAAFLFRLPSPVNFILPETPGFVTLMQPEKRDSFLKFYLPWHNSTGL